MKKFINFVFICLCCFCLAACGKKSKETIVDDVVDKSKEEVVADVSDLDDTNTKLLVKSIKHYTNNVSLDYTNTYAYDENNRLVEETAGTIGDTTTIRYKYDDNGNNTHLITTPQTGIILETLKHYDDNKLIGYELYANNDLSEVVTGIFNDNLVTYTAKNSDDILVYTESYDYDELNRLITYRKTLYDLEESTKITGICKKSYTYDDLDNLVSEEITNYEFNSGVCVPVTKEVIEHFYDGNKCINTKKCVTNYIDNSENYYYTTYIYENELLQTEEIKHLDNMEYNRYTYDSDNYVSKIQHYVVDNLDYEISFVYN